MVTAPRERVGHVPGLFRTSVDSFPRAFGLPMVVDGPAFPSTCGSMGSVKRAASSLVLRWTVQNIVLIRWQCAAPGHGLSGSTHH